MTSHDRPVVPVLRDARTPVAAGTALAADRGCPVTAATLAPADRKTRMQLIINLAISGSYDAGICPCGEDECIHVEDARKALDIANRAIDRTPRDDAALAIYSEGWFRAAGIPEDEWSVTTAGNGGDSNG